MSEAIGFQPLKYPNEPVRFSVQDLEPFIVWCVDNEASDITIQSSESIFCDILGRKHKVTSRRLTNSEMILMISSIYGGDGALSRLNGGSDVDVAWSIRKDRDEILRFRVNMTAILSHGQKGYQITIRTIVGRAPLLETMDIPQEIVDAMCVKQGLVVITGATGSGKSTLLASVMDWRIRQPNAHLKILTYEAPIEFVYDDVLKPTSMIAQTEIGTHLQSFAHGVRNALRRKPEVILMGELRDRETIGEGVTASMTGHLVYGTLHTNGVADAVRRMVNAFDLEEKQSRAMDILDSLKVVVSQMLVPSTDGRRVAIREYLVFNQDVKNYLLNIDINEITPELKKMLALHGRTFAQDALEKKISGIISEDDYKMIIRSTQGE